MKRIVIVHLLMLSMFKSFSTHIIGGQIHHKFLDGNRVEFTFIGYRDTDGVLYGPGVFDFGDGEKYGDEEGELLPWEEIVTLENGIEVWKFRLVHEYTTTGFPVVSYSENFRSSNVLNMSGSVATNFYVESMLKLDQLVPNTSPEFTRHPVFKVLSGRHLITNFSHEDADGDSLSYVLTKPLQAAGVEVSGYTLPIEDIFYSTTSAQRRNYKLDPINGNLIWDVPDQPGNYSIALRIDEWKSINGEKQLVGSTTIDYLIEVLEDNSPSIEISDIISECTSGGDEYASRIEIRNPDEAEIQVKVNTLLDALKINDLSVQEWASTFSESVFTDELITLDLFIDQNQTANFDGWNNVIFEIITISEPSNQEIVYSFNNQINIGCLDEWLITSTLEEQTIETIQFVDNQVIINQNMVPISVKIFDTSGKMVKTSYLNATNQKRKHVIDYPFSANTVYIIFANSSAGNVYKKLLITE